MQQLNWKRNLETMSHWWLVPSFTLMTCTLSDNFRNAIRGCLLTRGFQARIGNLQSRVQTRMNNLTQLTSRGSRSIGGKRGANYFSFLRSNSISTNARVFLLCHPNSNLKKYLLKWSANFSICHPSFLRRGSQWNHVWPGPLKTSKRSRLSKQQSSIW